MHDIEIYYERELAYLRQLLADFARRRPKIGDRLGLDQVTGSTDDPQVARAVEAFAFLSAPLRGKLNDAYPELTDSLLGALYPHFLAPIPSLSVAEFTVDPKQGKLTRGHTIAAGSQLYTREIDDVPCYFRTVYPLTLWPVRVESAELLEPPFGLNIVPPPAAGNVQSLLRLQLRTTGDEQFASLELDRLRFYLQGEERTVNVLYEALFNHVRGAVLRSGSGTQATTWSVAPQQLLRPVGFGPDEGLLPYPSHADLGYRLLTEYFAFPQKFLFADLALEEAVVAAGLPPAAAQLQDFGELLEVLVFFDIPLGSFAARVNADLFRLGCTPIVNLFAQNADPINVATPRSEYRVVPDVKHPGQLEIYSVDQVERMDRRSRQSVPVDPLVGIVHDLRPSQGGLYWYTTRRPSVRKDDAGSDVFLSVVDLTYESQAIPSDLLAVETTCTNRDLPARLAASDLERLRFNLQGQAPLKRIVPLVRPTSPRPPLLPPALWGVVSQLSPNHLSITGSGGAAALRESLQRYNPGRQRSAQQAIDGIAAIRSRRSVAPIGFQRIRQLENQLVAEPVRGFGQGIEIEIEFDPDKYQSDGIFLLACVLEVFLALHASANSFTRLTALKQGEGEPFRRWPPRQGRGLVL